VARASVQLQYTLTLGKQPFPEGRALGSAKDPFATGSLGPTSLSQNLQNAKAP
jgi:hypothetical protein